MSNEQDVFAVMDKKREKVEKWLEKIESGKIGLSSKHPFSYDMPKKEMV